MSTSFCCGVRVHTSEVDRTSPFCCCLNSWSERTAVDGEMLGHPCFTTLSAVVHPIGQWDLKGVSRRCRDICMSPQHASTSSWTGEAGPFMLASSRVRSSLCVPRLDVRSTHPELCVRVLETLTESFSLMVERATNKFDMISDSSLSYHLRLSPSCFKH